MLRTGVEVSSFNSQLEAYSLRLPRSLLRLTVKRVLRKVALKTGLDHFLSAGLPTRDGHTRMMSEAVEMFLEGESA